MAAGVAWNGLRAAELGTTAASYESVITWADHRSRGCPASMAMVAAAQPHSAWLTYTAEARCACRLAGHGVGGRLRGGRRDDSAAGGRG